MEVRKLLFLPTPLLSINQSSPSVICDLTLHRSEYEDIMPNIVSDSLLYCNTSQQSNMWKSSPQNRIKSKPRTNLNNILLNDLMSISEDGSSMTYWLSRGPENMEARKEAKVICIVNINCD